MQKSPLAEADTLFEELLQDLPADVAGLAREFKAFPRTQDQNAPAAIAGGVAVLWPRSVIA